MATSDALTGALRRMLAVVEADLRAKSDVPDLQWAQGLRAEYDAARAAGRTAQTWTEWREGEIALAAVAWVLGTVFVRFCEDNRLIDGVWIGGSQRRMALAMESETAFYAQDPSRDSQAWLRDAFAELAKHPASRALVDPEHSPVWTAPLGADACDDLLRFWRQQDEHGGLVWSLADPDWDTRFLGDIYQDLSEHAKKKYALLQTPDFVEEFILDRTLTPAIEQVPLAQVNLIDPTCGSGHFLLGAFRRLLAAWEAQAPGMDARERIQTVLDAVNGVDINPFAVAIARFRLMLAAMRADGATTLAGAPGFRPSVAVADSLLAGDPSRGEQTELVFGDEDELAVHRYAAEDVDDYPGILHRRQYQVVVGNPPYITAEDAALNSAYRVRYSTCYREFALTVPFMELFFDLATRGGDGRPPGWVGQITSNSFMKREFGSKLIEDMLSGADPLNPVDLTDVIDTSGAYIPGHGTPTVILVGRRRRPTGDTVHAVLGVRGEPGQPEEPVKGKVWSQIVEHIDDPRGFDGEYVTVTKIPRDAVAHHPWSLTGGRSMEVKAAIEAAPGRLASTMELAGYTGQTNADAAFLAPARAWSTHRVEAFAHRQVVIGEVVRDYHIGESDHALFLYGPDALLPVEDFPGVLSRQWPFRTVTWSRATFAKRTYREEGRTWWEWHQVALARLRTPLSIAFAFVATHNHFVLDRGGKVFKQSAPVIKLPADATLEDHLGLLGVLNSSVACFWLKQVSHKKGGSPESGGGEATQPWSWSYEFTGTKLQEFPLPASLPSGYGEVLDDLASRAAKHLPAAVIAASDAPTTRAALDAARAEHERLRAQMVAWQEELDWYCYRLYGLLPDELTAAVLPESPIGQVPDLPTLALGQRAFEVVLARRIAEGVESSEWFARHGSTRITDLPADWPPAYASVVQRRLDAIESVPAIRLLERPEFKRRWAAESWEAMETAALRAHVLDRLEDPGLWSGPDGPRTRTVAQLADAVRHDAGVQAALDLLVGRDADREKALSALLADESVPYLAALRYKPPGMTRRGEWERVWALQRREDAGETVDIPVPPKYAQGDFRKQTYWKHRGKLDVPKERFIAYPGAERDNDTTATYGWAGWDHGAQALALLRMLESRADRDGWDAERLQPLMAGLVELEPWLAQWHGDIDPEYGTSLAEDVASALQPRLDAAAITREDAAAWRPPETTRGRRSTR